MGAIFIQTTIPCVRIIIMMTIVMMKSDNDEKKEEGTEL
jgi:hypothetical protein